MSDNSSRRGASGPRNPPATHEDKKGEWIPARASKASTKILQLSAQAQQAQQPEAATAALSSAPVKKSKKKRSSQQQQLAVPESISDGPQGGSSSAGGCKDGSELRELRHGESCPPPAAPFSGASRPLPESAALSVASLLEKHAIRDDVSVCSTCDPAQLDINDSDVRRQGTRMDASPQVAPPSGKLTGQSQIRSNVSASSADEAAHFSARREGGRGLNELVDIRASEQHERCHHIQLSIIDYALLLGVIAGMVVSLSAGLFELYRCIGADASMSKY